MTSDSCFSWDDRIKCVLVESQYNLINNSEHTFLWCYQLLNVLAHRFRVRVYIRVHVRLSCKRRGEGLKQLRGWRDERIHPSVTLWQTARESQCETSSLTAFLVLPPPASTSCCCYCRCCCCGYVHPCSLLCCGCLSGPPVHPSVSSSHLLPQAGLHVAFLCLSVLFRSFPHLSRAFWGFFAFVVDRDTLRSRLEAYILSSLYPTVRHRLLYSH